MNRSYIRLETMCHGNVRGEGDMCDGGRERESSLHWFVRVCGCAVGRWESGVVCEGMGGVVGYGMWDIKCGCG